ncbi:hypothetical protein RRG08_060520 [Elysia crispata]|uniref:Uncharacterized protein n=1 Tax=Elysia crispata TaxID=231223 RepID=A0AAE1DWH3_9GAST|nr:hypothetical protein RRG08_060520 [Elysia crispata]
MLIAAMIALGCCDPRLTASLSSRRPIMKMMACVGVLAFLCLEYVMCQTTMAPVDPMLGDVETELTKRGGSSQILNLLRNAGLLDTLTNGI